MSKDIVNKEALVNRIAKSNGVSKYKVRQVIESLKTEIESAVAEGDKVSINGLLSIEPKLVPAHEQYVPYNGQRKNVGDHTKIVIRPSRSFVNKVNKDGDNK